jgi:hypothetical protein
MIEGIDAIDGTVIAMFDSAFDEISVPVPGAVEINQLQVTATATSEGPQLVLETHDPVRRRGAPGLGVSPLILAIATDGEEGVPQVNRVRTITDGGAAAAERWALRNRAGFGSIAELRLRVARTPARIAFPFSLPAIAIP